MDSNPLRRLGTFGQSLWLDYIRRDMLSSGQLQKMIDEDGICGITSNPAIFQKALAESSDYTEAIRIMARNSYSALRMYETLVQHDVRQAADLLRPIYAKTEGHDGYVSLEVNPHLAHDPQGTIREAMRLWSELDRPNIMIKVPATDQGLIAMKRLIADGINVNATLIFGITRYHQVANVFVSALEERASLGKPVQHIHSVASFFLSRIDQFVDSLLVKLASHDPEQAEIATQLQGHAAVACAKVAYQEFKEIFGSPRFHRLTKLGAHPQRLLWASTGTKNPEYSDVKYIEAVIGPMTVNTAPLATIDAYRDHGSPKSRIEHDIKRAHWVMDRLPGRGIDMDEVAQHLEQDGINLFTKSFDELIVQLDRRQL